MEPLFLAVIYGCNAGLFREALHEVYIPRIQQGNASFAANVVGAGGALLSVLVRILHEATRTTGVFVANSLLLKDFRNPLGYGVL